MASLPPKRALLQIRSLKCLVYRRVIFQLQRLRSLSKTRLTGNSNHGAKQNSGKLFESLFIKKDGINYKNPVVIIDDFDRALQRDYRDMDFLLRLLAPDTRSLVCNYLGKDVELPIADIILIFTANFDLGKKEAEKKLEALRDTIKYLYILMICPLRAKENSCTNYHDDELIKKSIITHKQHADDALADFRIVIFSTRNPARILSHCQEIEAG